MNEPDPAPPPVSASPPVAASQAVTASPPVSASQAASTEMASVPTQRTRIVLAAVARQPQVRHTATELTQQSPVGDALLRGLIRAQLAHAIGVAAVLAVGLGGLPLLFAVAPAVASARPLGIGLPWLLLGIAAYPFLFVLGAAYVRLAERTEAEFTDLVERPDR